MSDNRLRGRIQVNQVTKIFPNKEKNTVITALENVSLDVRPGEFVSIVGASGCGKSTLLRMITGLEHPSMGEILIDGEQVTGTDPHRGLVFQDPTLFPWLTVEDNIAFGLKSRKVYRQEKAAVEEYIHMIGLDGFQKSYPHQLSGGMAQRVSLARALVNEPTVMMLDEPLGALDAFTRMNMQDEIIRIWQNKQNTMILVTHDVDEAIYLSDRIIIMSPRPGRIREVIEIQMGRPRDRNHPDFIRYRSKILEMLDFAGKVEDMSYQI